LVPGFKLPRVNAAVRADSSFVVTADPSNQVVELEARN
jgi:hypothetical protein